MPVSTTGLAYLFWHAPPTGTDPDGYEVAQVAWQDALAAHRPPGFTEGWTWRLPVPPWLVAWPDTVYLDVYVVADFTSLGALNAHAPNGPLQGAHDAIAVRAAFGSGALFSPRGVSAGRSRPATPTTPLWFCDKPPGRSYSETLAGLEHPGRSVWLRQMVLGTGPELLVTGDAADGSSPVPAWSATATLVGARPKRT